MGCWSELIGFQRINSVISAPTPPHPLHDPNHLQQNAVASLLWTRPRVKRSLPAGCVHDRFFVNRWIAICQLATSSAMLLLTRPEFTVI